MCCDGFVAFVLHNVVDVCGAERVAVHEFEEFTGGAVVGDLGRGWVSVFILFLFFFYFFFRNFFLVLSYSFLFFLFFYFYHFLAIFFRIDTNRER